MYALFACGSNSSGQLGINHNEDVSRLTRCVFTHHDEIRTILDSRIVDIKAGGNHTLLLLEDGRVYAAGNNEDGRCASPTPAPGSEDRRMMNSAVFREVVLSSIISQSGSVGTGVSIRSRITHVAATWAASFFVVDDAVIYVCGTGDKGELGCGPGVTRSTTVKKILDLRQEAKNPSQPEESAKFADSIVQISACIGHVVVITEAGRVYGWGNARKGQLGQSCEREGTIWSPRCWDVDLGFLPRSVSTAKEFTLLLGDGADDSFLVGTGKHFADEVIDLENRDLDGIVFTSWNSIYHLNPYGKIRGWGRNDRGQCPYSDLPDIALVAAGSEHCVALSMEDQVLGWGWGEHGNCGLPLDKRGNVARRHNILEYDIESPRHKVVAVGAGCATSFVVVELDADG